MDKIDKIISSDVKKEFYSKKTSSNVNYLKILTILAFVLFAAISSFFLINDASVTGYVSKDIKQLNQCILDKPSTIYMKEPLNCEYINYENNIFIFEIGNNLDKPITVQILSINDCVVFPDEIITSKGAKEFKLICSNPGISNKLSIEYIDSNTGLTYKINGKIINV
jgi:hypothetical protein